MQRSLVKQVCSQNPDNNTVHEPAPPSETPPPNLNPHSLMRKDLTLILTLIWGFLSRDYFVGTPCLPVGDK